MRLLVATRNPGKMREFRLLLAPLQATLCFPPELGLAIEAVEDGDTYTENAHKKALTCVGASGLITLADDSGLEVDALDGAPGVRSARYAPGPDLNRVEALLSALAGVPQEERTARFRCVVVAVAPGGETHVAEGVCEGVARWRSCRVKKRTMSVIGREPSTLCCPHSAACCPMHSSPGYGKPLGFVSAILWWYNNPRGLRLLLQNPR
jgi:XTP/dITP diphosphohydrolase